MWGMHTIVPWSPWTSAEQPEISAIHRLHDEREVVALIGTPLTGPRGRFGIVGIPSRSIRLQPDNSPLSSLLGSRSGKFRIIALGYELGRPWVQLPVTPAPRGQPPGMFFEFDSVLVVDHLLHRWAVLGDPSDVNERFIRKITSPLSSNPAPCGTAVLHPLTSDALHETRIRAAKEHIAAGNIYQANIARRLKVIGDINAVGAVTALSSLNPVAHGSYIRTDNFELVSNTMETLLNLHPRSRLIESFPIKGTCRRLPHESPEDPIPQRLVATPKERAEHVMIVDLVRNDLGKICVPGTIKVPTLMGLEGYQGVWHGVSTVQGELQPHQQLIDALRALFPGGSITGAPKRRAIEIINELEEEPRGFYTGSIGMIAPDGHASFSILIRTLIKDNEGWSLSVGGGIVADSKPEREITETWEKVAVFRDLMKSPGSAQASVSSESKSANRLISKVAS